MTKFTADRNTTSNFNRSYQYNPPAKDRLSAEDAGRRVICRRRIEDLRMAKELGIGVNEL